MGRGGRLALAAGLVTGALTLASPAGAQTTFDRTCDGVSPSAAPCVGFDKLAERASAECRRAGLPASRCAIPIGHQVGDHIVEAYRKSWLHRAAAFQYRLGGPLPFTDAQWLGTHNSFNTTSDPPTASKTDSNQQLSLTDQLDSDIRSIEIDLHWFPSLDQQGANAVVVCHARGPDQANFGCTNERRFRDVLPEVNNWLKVHPDAVLLLYLEDELGNAQGYAETVKVLDDVLGSRIYRPDPAKIGPSGCADLPLNLTRDHVHAHGAQVVIVGNCRSGWGSRVFGWDDVHVESGSTSKYRPYPACDATYGPDVYASKLVRYYEDSTFVATAIDPTWRPADRNAELLTPQHVFDMTRCGVNLFGFDQFLPGDGRIGASIWSWATEQPKRSNGACTVQGADSRWVTTRCSTKHRAACRVGSGWKLTLKPVTYPHARDACVRRGGRFGLPRTGDDNMRLRTLAAKNVVWIAYRLPG